MGIDMDDLRKRLKEKGHKMTTQRRVILDAIIENRDEHLTPEEIYDIVKTKYPEIGIATVYRTLQLLEKLNIICRLNFDDGYNRYELNYDSEEEQHHHLICLNCGRVMEVKLDHLKSLEKQIEDENDFKVVDHNVKFFGYCTDCQ